MHKKTACFIPLVTLTILSTQVSAAESAAWQDSSKSPRERAQLLTKNMTLDEKFHLLTSTFALGLPGYPKPDGAIGSAAYIAPNQRLGIPALQITDAGLGVTNPGNTRPGDGATSLPAGQATSGTFDPELAQQAGAMIGAEARHRGFNVLLAGGMNLVRDVRNGRNFEYQGEDPILSGEVAAAIVKGVQSQHIISTVKHFAVNSVETGRFKTSMNIDPSALHESDLLAFEIAIKQGDPGSIMCSYNLVNGVHSCENKFLLSDVLRNQWKYNGFVMSDWGALGNENGYLAIKAGLDQESASTLDSKEWFGDYLKNQVKKGQIPVSIVNTKVNHILYAMFANGLFDDQNIPTETADDIAAHKHIAQQVEEEGATLLQNTHNILPLAQNISSILVIGGHADKGVLSGGGSAAVMPRGGNAVPDNTPPRLESMPHPIIYDPDAPVAALQKVLPKTKINYTDGSDLEKTVKLAAKYDRVIVFATKWQGESLDAKDMSLDENTNTLIQKIAAKNPHIIVVLETGNPVEMPWLNQVRGVLAAWYPGSGGGTAIANLLTGTVNPSGRLTTTWPRSLNDEPRPVLLGAGYHAASMPGQNDNVPFSRNIDLNIEGANVGYKWFEYTKKSPLYPFGYGLSYTHFLHKNIAIKKTENGVVAEVEIENAGDRSGADIAQIYVQLPDGSPRRLAGYKRVFLQPHESKSVEIPISSYALDRFDISNNQWILKTGDYKFFFLNNSLNTDGPSQTLSLNQNQ